MGRRKSTSTRSAFATRETLAAHRRRPGNGALTSVGTDRLRPVGERGPNEHVAGRGGFLVGDRRAAVVPVFTGHRVVVPRRGDARPGVSLGAGLFPRGVLRQSRAVGRDGRGSSQFFEGLQRNAPRPCDHHGEDGDEHLDVTGALTHFWARFGGPSDGKRSGVCRGQSSYDGQRHVGSRKMGAHTRIRTRKYPAGARFPTERSIAVRFMPMGGTPTTRRRRFPGVSACVAAAVGLPGCGQEKS
jgi:hypothetical protein